MRVLVTGTEGCGIDRAERELRGAGHEVAHCTATCRHEQQEGPVDLRSCPRWDGIDVIVTAREHPLPDPVRAESILRCPLLRSIPLVVAGCPAPNPFHERTAAETFGYDELVSTCEGIATARRR